MTPIGFACARDPRDPQVFSGSPRAMLDSLAELGVEVRPLRADVDPRLEGGLVWALTMVRARSRRDLARPRELYEREHRDARRGAAMTWLRNRKVRRAARRSVAAAAIHYGTQYLLLPTIPYVTWEDSTVLQAKAYPWDHVQIREATFARAAARERACYEGARACCVQSHWAARSIVEDYGQPPQRVKVIGVGNNHRPRPVADRDWSRPRFLFVGRAWRRKNGDGTVRAFAVVRERYPDAELHVVGHHPRLDVPGVIGHGLLSLRDPGDRARLTRLFEQATCLVLPSFQEPSAQVHVEAAAAGVASIGTINGGVSTLIGEAGKLVDPECLQEIVEAMLLLAQPEVAASLGALALERSKLFTWRKVAERLLRALALPGIDQAQLAEFL